MQRYRFADFVLSPRRRVLARQGRELPLIPRYFDLLVFLVERRHEAVHRRDIFDRVWSDVIVSDSALSQAVRTLRRTLGDDSREPQFIRTVARHGYRFVFPDVIEEPDEGNDALATTTGAPVANGSGSDTFDALLERACASPASQADDEDRQDAAERLHALGTEEALARLGTREGHARARALLRDTRWAVPGSHEVPLVSAPSPAAAFAALVRLRARRAARAATARWLTAAAGSGVSGALAGLLGGLLLAVAPGSRAPVVVAPVLALVGLACGAAGGAGVGAGLSAAEALARSLRSTALVLGGAAGGLLVGAVAARLAEWSLATLVGVHAPLGGAADGLVLGAAAGLGYALATRGASDGLAAPRGRRRLGVCMATAAATAGGALLLAVGGWPLVGGSIHAIAEASSGAQAALTPLARLIGEPDFGPLTGALIGAAEGGFFGAGLAAGLTHRPATTPRRASSRTSHELLTDR